MNDLETEECLLTQREYLIEALRKNRQYLAYKLNGNEEEFPRSMLMRMLMQGKSDRSPSITDWSKTGMRFYRIISGGLYIFKFVKRNLLNKKSNNST